MRSGYAPKRKSARLKAMELLSYKIRSEKELRDRLLEGGYTAEETEDALKYVVSYGYINDREYALQYVSLKCHDKGRTAIAMELKKKGIDEELINEALSNLDYDEEEKVYELLLRRGGEPHSLDEKEYRRLFSYCARRGFKVSAVSSAMRRFDLKD